MTKVKRKWGTINSGLIRDEDGCIIGLEIEEGKVIPYSRLIRKSFRMLSRHKKWMKWWSKSNDYEKALMAHGTELEGETECKERYKPPEWLVNPVAKVNEIKEQMKDAHELEMERKCGRYLALSGYKDKKNRGWYHNLFHKEYFLYKTELNYVTASRMVRLAYMNELEFQIELTKYNMKNQR